jgi:MFS family permease
MRARDIVFAVRVRRVLPLYLVVFVGFVGYSLMIAIFTPLVLRVDGGMLPHDTSAAGRAIALGVSLALYPLAQFLGAPVIGGLSDRFGRKPTLLVSLSASLAYVVGPLAGGKARGQAHRLVVRLRHAVLGRVGAVGRRPQSLFVAWVAVPIVVANLGLVGWLARRMTARQMARRCSIVLGVAMATIVIPDRQAALWLTLGVTALAPPAASLMSLAPEGRIGSPQRG